MLIWIDDFLSEQFRSTRKLAPIRQLEAPRSATYLALSVFHRAGYFTSIPKCILEPTTRIVFLGIICDSTQCRFEVPADKLDKLEAIHRGRSDHIIRNSREISRKMHQHLGGGTASQSVHAPHVQTDHPVSDAQSELNNPPR